MKILRTDKIIIEQMIKNNASIYFHNKKDHDNFINHFFVKERNKADIFQTYYMKGIPVYWFECTIQSLMIMKHQLQNILKEK